MTRTVKIYHNPDLWTDYVSYAYVAPCTYDKIRSYLHPRGHDWDGTPATFVITTDDIDDYEGEPLTVHTCGEFDLPKRLTCHIIEFWLNPRARKA